MYHQHQGGSDFLSPRANFPQERHLFIHGSNAQTDSGLVLSTDAKPRLKWTAELHQRFIDAVNQLGGAEKATPKTVMRLMGIPGLTLYHLKSHLQKYRLSKNLQAQANVGATKTAVACVAPVEKAPTMSGSPISNTNVVPQPESTIHISEALQMQIEVQRQLNEQLEVQRHLQLRIEAQGKYLQAVLEKAQETLGKQSTGPTCQESAKLNISELMSQVSARECFSSAHPLGFMKGNPNLHPAETQRAPLPDCSLDSSLTTCEELMKEHEMNNHKRAVDLKMYNGNNNQLIEKMYLEQPNYKMQANQMSVGKVSNTDFGLTCFGTKLDLNSQEESDDSDPDCRQFDLNGFSWN